MSELIPTTLLSEAFRIDMARHDLRMIADQAHRQIILHEHATKAGSEVAQALVLADIPNRDALLELSREQESSTEPETKIKASSLARDLIAPKDTPNVGISRKDITTDVLSQLHPDRQTDTDIPIDEDLFKSITEAQQNDDDILLQGLYANTLASQSANLESPTATSLEKARYKTWIALQASKGRFETVEEIEIWRKYELGALPYKLRAITLHTAMSVFTRTLGASEEGLIRLPSECYEPVTWGLDSTQIVVKKILGDEVDLDSLSSVNITFFDDTLAKITAQLRTLTEYSTTDGMRWDYLSSIIVAEIGRKLSLGAEVLEVYKDDFDRLSLAVSGLSKFISRNRH